MARAHNILHLFVSLPVGGAENLLLNTVKGLDQQRFRSVVCCIREKGAIGEEIEALGFPVIAMGKLQRGGWDGSIVSELERITREQAIDLVHTHLYHANFYGRLAARRAGVPAVAAIHNTYPSHPKWHRRLINWYLARHSQAIIAGSDEIRNDILRWDRVPEKLIRVIPNTVNLTASESSLSRDQARARLGVAAGQTVLGTVGRLEEQKGHRVLLDAIELLRRQGLTPVLLLVGDGRMRDELEQQAQRLGIAGQVHFLGMRRDVGDLFRAMDLFVMPSLWEGLSLAMLSAMAAGLPVIATRVGGVSEVMGEDEYGFTLAPNDASALAAAIRKLMEQPELAVKVAARGRERVRGRYSDQALVRRLEKIYTDILT